MNATEFNARYPVGTPVFAYPGIRPEDGAGTRLVTRTRTEARLSASGDPVVWVEGEGAYICLTHVDPVAEDVWEAAREAEKQAEPEAKPKSAARLSPEREAEIAARAEAAAPGPWAAVELPPNAEFKHPAHWVTAEYTDDQGCSTSEVVADCPWRQSDAEFVAHAREDVPALLAELAAVRAERDRYRERALNAENRSIVDGREVCADCERPVPDGPCGVHSPDAVFQRAAREAAQLRAERDQARAELAEFASRVNELESRLCECEPVREHSDYKRPAFYQHAADCPVNRDA
ncbi:hypothetical protein [Streptomyces ardesiacus]|uniref:hypothetical protein n=1 Tax=Streptomyces ardesiacus TaxID=285564 RepID=UPI002FDC0D25